MGILLPMALAGLLAVPIILVLHMMRRKVRDVVQPSLMLWQKALAEAPPQPWRKLRTNLLMILQILAAVFVVAAMARPYLRGLAGESLIVVLDASVGMMAQEGDITRFEEARSVAGELLAQSPESLLIVVDSAPRIIANNVLAELQNIEPSYVLFDEAAAVGLVSVARELSEARVVLLSDRERPDVGEAYIVASGTDNVSITSITHSNDTDRTVALVRLRSFADVNTSNSVSVFADGEHIETRPISLAPDEEASLFFLNLPANAERVHAQLLEPSTFAPDDTAYSVVSSVRDSRVLLVSSGNVFLERALGLLPHIELSVANAGDIDNLRGFDLYIYDGIMPEELPSDGHIIIINPPQGNNFIVATEEENITSVNVGASPITSFLGDMRFAVRQARVLELPSWATEVVSSPQGTLVAAGQYGGQRIAVIGFDLHDTDLPLRLEFPILISNLVDFALPQQGIVATSAISVGDVVQLVASPIADEVNVIAPDDNIYALDPNQADFTPLLPGFYLVEQVVEGSREFASFAVNAPRGASDLRISDDVAGRLESYVTGFGSSPIQGLAIVIALALLAAEFFVYAPLRRRRGGVSSVSGIKLAGAMRVATSLLLVAALLSPSVVLSAHATATVFVVDVSDSAGDAVSALKEALSDASELVGIVSFGRSAVVDTPVSSGVTAPQNIRALADTSQTNIEQAIQLAASMFPEGVRRRIVLLSDGVETMGDAMSQAHLLRQQGISLVTVQLPPYASPEAQLSELRLPRNLSLGVGFELEVVAHSSVEQEAQLLIYRNNLLIHSRDISLRPGENRFAVADTSDQAGGLVYRAELLPQYDTFHQNNTIFAHSHVDGPPRILVVEGFLGAGAHVYAMISDTNAEVVRVVAPSAPHSLEGLRPYDAVVLVDVSLDYAPPGIDEALEAYVRTGGGLFVVGGQNSFALGGYRGTMLERALPVEMTITHEQEEGVVAMLVVLDRSGSMMDGRFGVTYMQLAVEATIRAVEELSDADYFGTIAFDHIPLWFSYLRPVLGNRAQMIYEVASIAPGGGTAILPALAMAYEAMRDAPINPQFRHILLLTDGIAEQYGYDPIINGMLEAGITLSTVAFGGDADTELLISLAEMGGGRYYFVNEFTDLPRIFATEAQLAGRSFINHEDFFPEALSHSTIISGIETVPLLGGWVSTSIKPLGQAILVEPSWGEPILAKWQYGLGNAAVFTSDLGGLWSEAWLNSPEGVALVRNTVSYLARAQAGREFMLYAQPDGDGSLMRLILPDGDVMEASLILEGLGSIELAPVAPGVFEGFSPQSSPGAYTAVIELEGIGLNEVITTGITIPFGAEYDMRLWPLGGQLLLNLAQASGGVIIDLDQMYSVFDIDTFQNYTNVDIDYLLLSAALILLLLDIVLRRFPVRLGLSSKTSAKLDDNTLNNNTINNTKLNNTKLNNTKQIKNQDIKNQGAVSTSASLMSAKQRRHVITSERE